MPFEDNKKIAWKGGQIAGNTRKEIEAQTGDKIVSAINAKVLTEKRKLKN